MVAHCLGPGGMTQKGKTQPLTPSNNIYFTLIAASFRGTHHKFPIFLSLVKLLTLVERVSLHQ